MPHYAWLDFQWTAHTKSDYVKQATTLRLPPNYLRRLRIMAAVRDTTSVATGD